MQLRAPHRPLSRRHLAGLTLIELMVGLVIALVISLVVFNVFIATEGQRRTTAGGSDAQQAGALSSYTLMRYLRMGGAGIDRTNNLWGCNMQIATSTDSSLVPLPGDLEAPFSTLGLTDIRATPVLIINGSDTADDDAESAAPDAVMSFGGVHRSINTFLQGSRVPAADAASVYNSVGLQENDLLLAVEQTPGAANFGGSCQVVQATSEIDVNAGSPTYRQSIDNNGRTVQIGGAFTPSSGLAPLGVPYTGEVFYANLGGLPLFRLFALGPSTDAPSELRMYDVMLGPTDTNPQSLGDGVVNLQAIYGVAAPGSTSNVIDDWVHPVGAWRAGALMDGSAASAALIDRIRAIRVVMVTRSALPERDPVSPDEYTVFADDASLTFTIERDTDAQNYRYRVFDETVPVRNKLLPPTPPLIP